MRSIPRIEQHVHLEGTIAPEMAVALAERNGVNLPEGFIRADGTYNWRGFDAFIKAYDIVAECVKTAQDYEDITYDYLVRSAREGVIFTEIGYSPFHCKMAAGLEHGEAIEVLARGIERAKAETGIEARLLCIAVRYLGELDAPQIAVDIATYLKDNPSPWVTGFGLAGWEREDDVLAFDKAFAIAHEAGLGLTAHAGENCGPVSVWNTLKAIPHLQRIGHGVRSLEDDELIKTLVDRGIVLEVCPSSNIVLEIFENSPSLEQHPLPKLLEAGVLCTINSDDPPFFHTSVGREYELVSDVLGLSEDQVREACILAVKTAFVQEDLREKLLAQF